MSDRKWWQVWRNPYSWGVMAGMLLARMNDAAGWGTEVRPSTTTALILGGFAFLVVPLVGVYFTEIREGRL